MPGILEAWYGGTRGGAALARVLFGDVNPSGRLPVSFPKADEHRQAIELSEMTQ